MTEPLNLRLDIYSLRLHAQDFMRLNQIKYQFAVPQSMGDQWWFFNCENYPDPLPEELSLITQDPEKLIGYGLSKEMANAIKEFKNAREGSHESR